MQNTAKQNKQTDRKREIEREDEIRLNHNDKLQLTRQNWTPRNRLKDPAPAPDRMTATPFTANLDEPRK